VPRFGLSVALHVCYTVRIHLVLIVLLRRHRRVAMDAAVDTGRRILTKGG
jgi:hypothetical protein